MKMFNRSLAFIFSLICLCIQGAASAPSVMSQLSKAIKKKDIEKVQHLFKQHSIPANQRLKNGYTPLCWAVRSGSDEIVTYLAEEQKADVNMQSHKTSPIHQAAANGQLSMLTYLIEQKKATLAIAAHRNVLSIGTLHGQKEVVDYLIKRPTFQPHIDGAIALSIATKQNNASIVNALQDCGVPQLPNDEVPGFFYNDVMNKAFGIQPTPLVAYTLKDAIQIYQLKVDQQRSASSDCIQEQLKEAACKLGGSPEDHQRANPIYGGSCGYHAFKNALMGLLILTDYDQLAQSYVAEDKDKQLKALECLNMDLESLASSKPSHDFDPLQFMEKIHANVYRVINTEGVRKFLDKRNIFQQSLCFTRRGIAQNKVERVYDSLVYNRFPAHAHSTLNTGNVCSINSDIMKELRLAKLPANLYNRDTHVILKQNQIAYLRKQIALFRVSSIYRHAFVLSYDTSTVSGYGARRHVMSIILDKRGAMTRVLLLESNNNPDMALKQIVFDFIGIFTDAKKYPLSRSKKLYQSALYPFEFTIDKNRCGMVHITHVINSYLQTKNLLKVKVDRNCLHKVLYLFQKIKHLYKKALYLERNNIDTEAVHTVLNQCKKHALFEKMSMSDQEILDRLRQEEIALHQLFEQLEQEELDRRLSVYIRSNNLPKIKQLLVVGANPKQIRREGSLGKSKPEIIDFFLRQGYLDIEAKLGYGETLLMQALYCENDPLVCFLLEKGADVNARDIHGATPMYYITRKQETIDLLVQRGADIHIINSQGQSLADIFFKRGRIYIAENLVEKYKVTLHLQELVQENPL